MSSPRTPWTPTKCPCGFEFTSKSAYLWNGKSGADSAFVCWDCWIKERREG